MTASMSSRKTKSPYLVALLVAASGCASIPTPPVPPAPDLAGAIQQAANADTAVVAFTQPQPCCPKQTLPQFLGITGACNAVLGCVDNLRNRLGLLFPGLEAVPPVLAITDPANLEPGAPAAVKTAAEVKAQEDQAAQKIKALRYLATIGCGGCYPDVEAAFIAGMDDCTEEVRYEAVLAIRETTGKNCCFCAQGACCTEKIQNKLRDLAFKEKYACCPAEPSARVRRQARLALAACGPPVVIEEPETPEEAPEEIPGPKDETAEGPTDVDVDVDVDGEGADVDVDVDVDKKKKSAEPPLPPVPPKDPITLLPPPATAGVGATGPRSYRSAAGPSSLQLNAAPPTPLPVVFSR